MEKRLIIAIAVSALIIFTFQRYFQPQTKPGAQSTVSSVRPLMPAQAKKESVVEESIITPTGEKHANEIETTIETDRFVLTFTNIGGALKSIFLKEYDTVLCDNLVAPQSTFSLIAGRIGKDITFGEYKLKREDKKLIYTYTTQSGLKIVKQFTIYNSNDCIELQLIIENPTSQSVTEDYTIIGPSWIEPATKMKGKNFIEMNGELDGRLIKKTRIRSGQELLYGITSWVALKNRYFAIAMEPTGSTDGILVQDIDGKLTAGIKVKPRTIYSTSYLQDSYYLYAGPLIKERLAVLNPKMEQLLGSGIFGGISNFLLAVLRGINSVVHNWGVSIIVVTMLINLVMFPLTKKSFHSMQKMQELQPHMEKLRQVHKDNPQKLNREMAELYRKYNVNPFGGCLPMLLQLPIFISFYQALMKSIELKNAHFLWIKDLSSPDALFTFSQSFPVIGNQFNLLPIITLIVMFIQQKSSMASSGTNANSEMAKQQKLMTLFFPIFFGFILYGFPAGLVLYWLTNSSLMMFEQIMLKKHKVA